MLNKYTTDRNFQKFCKAMHKDSGISIIPFQVWKQKHLDELTEAWEIIQQDTKVHLINTLKK